MRRLQDGLRDDESLKQFLDTVPYMRKVFLVAEEMDGLVLLGRRLRKEALAAQQQHAKDVARIQALTAQNTQLQANVRLSLIRNDAMLDYAC